MTNSGRSNDSADETLAVKSEEDTEIAREERKATGRSIAIIIFLSVMSLAIYHVIQQKTTVLAGVLVPAMILFTYLFFVIHVSQREKEKRQKQLESVVELDQSEPGRTELHKRTSTASQPSVSLPSTSGFPNSSKTVLKSSTFVRTDLKTTRVDPSGTKKPRPKPFVKAPSQSHIQSFSTHIAIENERKKLKKSRSFDKNNFLLETSKKIKTKN